jgi:KIF-binding protein
VEAGKGTIGFEKIYTLTLYYLAQVIGGDGDLTSSAKYCHQTLRRQLEYNDYETIDWALNSATLSQYYFTQNCLKQSRHLLAAASYMLDKYEEEMITADMTPEQKEAKLEEFQHRSADVSRCWAKYAIHILSTSKDRLLHDRDDRDQLGEIQSGYTNFEVSTGCDEFKTLSVHCTLYENQIVDEFLLTFEDAKVVFLLAQSWLNKAKEYYNSESEASEYAIITQDLASLYKHLAFFDEDDDNQCKLHKRRADLLEDLVKLLNPTYYLNICRECWYELGLTYSTMLDIKLSKLEQLTIKDRPTPHQLQKINILCEKSIAGFQAFVDSYKDKKTNEIPNTISDDEMQPILFAYFHFGRLFYKITTPDRRMTLLNLNNSLNNYALFVKKLEQRPTLMGPFAAELGVCREMTNLLPLKIKKLFNEGNI